MDEKNKISKGVAASFYERLEKVEVIVGELAMRFSIMEGKLGAFQDGGRGVLRNSRVGGSQVSYAEVAKCGEGWKRDVMPPLPSKVKAVGKVISGVKKDKKGVVVVSVECVSADIVRRRVLEKVRPGIPKDIGVVSVRSGTDKVVIETKCVMLRDCSIVRTFQRRV